MLTVMYRDPDGNETINEAISVYKDTQGSPEWPHGYVATTKPDGERIIASFGDPRDSQPDSKTAKIFVMNESGATVAKYTL